MTTARPDHTIPPPTTPQYIAELAAVHAAVTAHLEGKIPENMFAPFTLLTGDTTNDDLSTS
jgi:hypothetical protein